MAPRNFTPLHFVYKVEYCEYKNPKNTALFLFGPVKVRVPFLLGLIGIAMFDTNFNLVTPVGLP